MELNKINSSNKTDKILDSMSEGEEKLLYVNESAFDNPRLRSKTEDESIYEEYGQESVYEEYLYEDDSAQYRFQSNIIMQIET